MNRISPLRTAALALALLLASPATAQRWLELPPTPAAVAGGRTGVVKVNGAGIFYREIGKGPPVVMVHGGLANSDYFGLQVAALAPRHRVILIDSRGHGRSATDDRPIGYDLMADDVVAVLDALHVPTADIVGWSDGAIIGLDLAMRHPDRVRRIFAFAPNTDTSGLKADLPTNPVFNAFIARSRAEYARLSPTPRNFDAFTAQISKMWETQPHWTDAQLRSIKAPVQVVDGDHDEGIRRDHLEYIADTIPGAGLLILPNASHFAFLQNPALFNAALLDFLDE